MTESHFAANTFRDRHFWLQIFGALLVLAGGFVGLLAIGYGFLYGWARSGGLGQDIGNPGSDLSAWWRVWLPGHALLCLYRRR